MAKRPIQVEDDEEDIPQRRHHGISAINERHKEQQAEWRPKVPFLRLNEGEKALVRILSTGDDDHMATAYYHRTQSQDGGQTRYRLVYCPGTEDLECDLCEAGAKRTENFGVWVWAKKIYRKEQNKRAQGKDDPNFWPRVAISGEAYFKQTVEGPMFWQRGLGHGQSIWKTIVAFFARDGSLRKRDYEITRLGTGLSTVIQIMPGPDVTKLTAEQKAVIGELPDSFEVLAGRATYPPAGEDGDAEVEPLEDLEEEDIFGGGKKKTTKKVVEEDDEDEEEEEVPAPRRKKRVVAEEEDDDEEEEAPAPKKKAAPVASKRRKVVEEEDEDEDEDEDEPAPKRGKSVARVAKRLAADDDDDDDDEDEEEPAPKKKTTAKKRVVEEDDDDDEEEEIATAKSTKRKGAAAAASGRRGVAKRASAFDEEEEVADDDEAEEENIFDD